MVLHELAHAYHHQFLEDGFDNPEVKAAYDRAMKSKLYQKVLRINGRDEKAYAATNPMEYFAEATEAFFGTNDFYPFVRSELKRHDPAAYDSSRACGAWTQARLRTGRPRGLPRGPVVERRRKSDPRAAQGCGNSIDSRASTRRVGGCKETLLTNEIFESECKNFSSSSAHCGRASSLMVRCLDDHPAAIGLCESEINRALYSDYFVELHCQRMVVHGLSLEQSIRLLDRKKQDDLEAFMRTRYQDVTPLLCDLYGKYDDPLVGDKSPDYYRSPELVEYLASSFPLIYTVRDPRAILSSIETQSDATPQEKAERWDFLIQNYVSWKLSSMPRTYWPSDTKTSSRARKRPMRSVHYSHLGLAYSSRFLGKFKRCFPERFLWTTAVDWETGIRKEFDSSRISSWMTN